MTDDEDKARQAPSEPPRVPSPTPPPPDMSLFDEITGRYDDPLEALASIITPPPRPVEEEELRPEDALDAPPEPSQLRQSQPDFPRPAFGSKPELARSAQASQPDLSRAAFGSQSDRDSIPDSGDGASQRPSTPAALVPEAAASRRARARVTLRIPDDDIPLSASPQPPAVETEPDKEIINPVAVVHAMRIIAIGEPVHGTPRPAAADEPRDKMSSDTELLPLSESDMQSAWTPGSAPPVVQSEPSTTEELEVEPEPDDEEQPGPAPGLVVVPSPLPPPPRPRMASIPAMDGPSPAPPAVGFGPLPPVEPPRPRMASVPPVDAPTPSAPAVAAYGPLPPVEPPRPRMASVPPVDAPTPSAPPVATYGPLPAVELPRPRMASLPPVEPVARPAETVELDDDDVAPDSARQNEAEPATVRAPPSDASPPISAPPPPKPKPTPSPPQIAPVIVSTEDVLAAVSPLPAQARAVSPSPPPVSVEEVVPEPTEEVEAEEVVPEPPAPPPKPAVSELKPPPRKQAAVGEDGIPRRRVRPPWEEVFSDDFIRAFPRLTPKQVSTEVTFVEESLGVQKGGVVLDLACGAGQHAVEFASRGYSVVGYDLSLTMLALAADEAQERGQKINFLQGDMREMAFEEMFDAVYSWATSFGFFDEEKNVSVLRRIHRALRQSGMFLLDLVNRDFIVSRLPTLNWFEGDGCVCIDDAQFDSITSRLRVKRTLMREDGKSREVEYSVRLYALHEIGKMLHDSGFKVVEVSGHPATAGAYFGADSPRMIILAERR